MFWKTAKQSSQTAGNVDTAAKQKSKFSNIRTLLFKIQNGGEVRDDFSSTKETGLPESIRPVTIAAMNQKGGCGKTTTVVNLSAALAEQGYRVLVVDMDPQAHASLGLGVASEHFRRSIRDLLLDREVTFGDVMRSTPVANLDILPSSIDLAAAQMDLANLSRGEMALRHCLLPIEKNYDFIFIDCPPTLNLLTLNALCYAKKVLVPVQTHYYALEGMKELFRTIEAMRARFNTELEILGILATLFDKRMSIAGEMLQELRNYFSDSMFETVIHTNVKLIEAPMVQQPITVYAPQSKAAHDFVQLAEEVLRLVTRQN